MTDISTEGMAFHDESVPALQVGDGVEIVLKVVGRVDAVTVHRDGKHYGVRFTPADNAHRDFKARLLRYVYSGRKVIQVGHARPVRVFWGLIAWFMH